MWRPKKPTAFLQICQDFSKLMGLCTHPPVANIEVKKAALERLSVFFNKVIPRGINQDTNTSWRGPQASFVHWHLCVIVAVTLPS